MTPVLIHAHTRPTVIMVHGDAVTMTDLILPLNHPDIMIGIIHPDRITVVIGIIETSQMIVITTIEISITALATMIGDIKTQMVSPQLGTLIITVTPILHKIGKMLAAIRVVIWGTTPIYIIIRVMDGTKAHSMEERVRIGDSSNHTLVTNPNNHMAGNSHHIAVTTVMGDVPAIIILPCQNYLAL